MDCPHCWTAKIHLVTWPKREFLIAINVVFPAVTNVGDPLRCLPDSMNWNWIFRATRTLQNVLQSFWRYVKVRVTLTQSNESWKYKCWFAVSAVNLRKKTLQLLSGFILTLSWAMNRNVIVISVLARLNAASLYSFYCHNCSKTATSISSISPALNGFCSRSWGNYFHFPLI